MSGARKRVEEKLEILKNDPEALHSLRRRLHDHSIAYVADKEDIGPVPDNIIRSNKEQAFRRKEELHTIEKQRQKEHDEHCRQVRQQKEERDAQQEEWKMQLAARNELNRTQRNNGRSNELREAEDRQRAQHFTAFILLLSHLQAVKLSLLQDREERAYWQTLEKASLVVQKVWRAYLDRRDFKRKRKAAVTIQQGFRETIMARLEPRRKEAAGVILMFLQDWERTSRFKIAMKDLRLKVMRLRREQKELDTARQAQEAQVTRQWDVSEALAVQQETRAEEKRQAALKKKAALKPGSAPKLKDTPAGKKKEALQEAKAKMGMFQSLYQFEQQPLSADDPLLMETRVPVPTDVKVHVVCAYLAIKRAAYVAALAMHWLRVVLYKRRIREVEAVQQARTVVTGTKVSLDKTMPVRPLFNPMASEREMTCIMQQGVHDAILHTLREQRLRAEQHRLQPGRDAQQPEQQQYPGTDEQSGAISPRSNTASLDPSLASPRTCDAPPSGPTEPGLHSSTEVPPAAAPGVVPEARLRKQVTFAKEDFDKATAVSSGETTTRSTRSRQAAKAPPPSLLLVPEETQEQLQSRLALAHVDMVQSMVDRGAAKGDRPSAQPSRAASNMQK